MAWYLSPDTGLINEWRRRIPLPPHNRSMLGTPPTGGHLSNNLKPPEGDTLIVM